MRYNKVDLNYDGKEFVMLTGRGWNLCFDISEKLKVQKIEGCKELNKSNIHRITFESFEYYLMPLAERG